MLFKSKIFDVSLHVPADMGAQNSHLFLCFDFDNRSKLFITDTLLLPLDSSICHFNFKCAFRFDTECGKVGGQKGAHMYLCSPDKNGQSTDSDALSSDFLKPSTRFLSIYLYRLKNVIYESSGSVDQSAHVDFVKNAIKSTGQLPADGSSVSLFSKTRVDILSIATGSPYFELKMDPLHSSIPSKSKDRVYPLLKFVCLFREISNCVKIRVTERRSGSEPTGLKPFYCSLRCRKIEEPKSKNVPPLPVYVVDSEVSLRDFVNGLEGQLSFICLDGIDKIFIAKYLRPNTRNVKMDVGANYSIEIWNLPCYHQQSHGTNYGATNSSDPPTIQLPYSPMTDAPIDKHNGQLPLSGPPVVDDQISMVGVPNNWSQVQLGLYRDDRTGVVTREDPRFIPSGWDVRIDEKTEKLYFAFHATKQTTFTDPRYCPDGWDMRLSENGQIYFAFAPARKTTFVDPRGLPSGYSPCLDEETGRMYFKIHAERRTTWEDPRAGAESRLLSEWKRTEKDAWISSR